MAPSHADIFAWMNAVHAAGLPPNGTCHWRRDHPEMPLELAPTGWLGVRVRSATRTLCVYVPAHEPNAAETVASKAWEAYRELNPERRPS